ncbi:hypothetical protein VCRA2114E365_40086 [Vibrio crassostreae]|jgi:hypothetical protein|uniref:Uncharacterized protein n=1 Tax=Vibrio crassostreae TaxID=246167 RepID=A0ABP1WXP7_9VIBR|nr:hypothetical protein VCRA2119O381_1230003 [Vibrio crassostreae]CAK1802901.1 hypothetical protein VCRA2111O320_170089 [Vibrio crassostreae]CAK1823236.1 hypothetical protein VCRA2117O380_180028 [Vibrio crassostreae]CAK1824908.1 hypothetical protein VCRA2113O324_180089 [Vibrio crassostreae]CAK2047463.1 hypothetical protein VCRA2116O26_30023 [Vibrio crassostreae]
MAKNWRCLNITYEEGREGAGDLIHINGKHEYQRIILSWIDLVMGRLTSV